MIGLYSPDVPPVPGGVSDHTLALARAMEALGGAPAILARYGDPALFAPLPCAMDLAPRDLAGAARRLGVGVVVVQYVPFAFARRGLSPALCLGLRKVARAGITVAVVVHEPFVPFTRIPWLVTGWPMRWQLAYLLRLSRFAYAPAPRYVDICRHYAGPGTRVALAPIGATMPVSRVPRAEARRAFDLRDGQVVIGVFSPAAAGFEHQWVAEAAAALEDRADVVWLVFGFGSTAERFTVPGRNVIRLGPSDAAGLGKAMRAVDVAAAPYTDGLTMRRSGAMFALAHGVPTVSSIGHLYDPALGRIAACEPSARAFTARLVELAGDPARRAALAERARGYWTVASIEVLAQQLVTDLGGIR